LFFHKHIAGANVQDTDQTELEFELQNALLTYPHWRLTGSFNMPQNAVYRDSI
jgi:hypothetical protein